MADRSKSSKSTGGKSGSGKSSGGKGAAGRKSSASGKKNQKQVQEQEDSFIYTEVAIIASFAVAVLCFLSNFHLCGSMGDVLRSVQLGIFGMIGYAAPLLLFAGTCFIMANRGSALARIKMAAVIAGVCVLCGLAQLMFGGGYVEGLSIGEIYSHCAETGTGGGALGGILVLGIGSVLGTIGAYLILLVGLVICIVCITEKSVVSVVKKGSGKAYQYAREDAERRYEIHQEKKEERRRLREEKKVRGVNLNSTKLEAFPEPEPDIPEPETDIREPERDILETAGGAGYEYQSESLNEPQDEYGYDGGREYAAEEQDDSVPGPVVWSGGKKRGPLPEFDPKVGNQIFMDDLLPKSSDEDGRRTWDQADVFTGRINMPPVYIDPEDDTVPFDGEDSFTERKTGIGAAAGETVYEPDPYTDGYGREYQTAEAGSAGGQNWDIQPKYADDSSWDAQTDSADSQSWDAEPTDAGNSVWNSQAESAGSRAWNTQSADADNPAWDVQEENTDSPAWDAQTESGDSYAEAGQETGGKAADGQPADEFVVAGGQRRIVTASGKVIEVETEDLRKKIEPKRQPEAVRQEGNRTVVIGNREDSPAAAAKGPGAQKPQAAGSEAVQVPEPVVIKKEYVFPPTSLLKRGNSVTSSHSERECRETAIKLQQTLRDFGVGVTVTDVSCGPSVTRYELHPEQGVKVSKILSLTDDIKLSLAAADIRIEAPIPGKSAVGIEVPNKENNVVYLREVLETPEFMNSQSKLTFAVGKDIGGQAVVTDIAKMPHLLIAGSTGSGKSVCINTLIMSIIYKANPDDVKLIMVDPKVVELSVYNGIPHLLIPVVTDPKKASGALNWAVAEMDDRYKKFAQYNVRDLKGFNAKVESIRDIEDENKPVKMPQIVIIIDELADLMMVAPGEVEGSICRLAQLARAAGIHLVIATQRPSVDVITGLIKANVPSRIAFAVSSGVDSRTILDMVGAEKLLGKGDMLFYPAGMNKPQRVQGAFVSDSEVSKVVEFLTQQELGTGYNQEVQTQIAMPVIAGGDGRGERDEYFAQAGKFIIEKEKGSIGMLQRMFKIGFNRAARIMDQLAEAGVVGDEEGTKPRKVLMTLEEFEAMLRDE